MSTRTVRWIARAWGIASLVLIAAFIAGERSLPGTLSEWLGFAFFPVGILAGMIVAWWREGPGGSITVGSLVAFYSVHFATSGVFPRGPAWVAFAAPGFLFLYCWYRSRAGRAASS